METITGRHYATLEPLSVSWEGPRITAVGALTGQEAAVAARSPLIAPALFDIQMNGYAGLDFAAPENLAAIAARLAQHGVARFCPTVTTGSDDRISRALRAIAQAREASSELCEAAPMIHLEGPYISEVEGARGAHPPEHCKDPDWDHFSRFQDAAGGAIGLVTLAPERSGSAAFIARCAAAGIAVAIAHTEADAADVAAAADAGATLSTHLGNGLRTPIDRHHNPIWPQLAEPRLHASFIADGQHLPAPALIAMLRSKGIASSILVSDSVAQAGLPPGVYGGVGGKQVEVLPSGRIQLYGTPYLSGSGANLAQCVSFAVRCGAAGMADAVDMATAHPAALLGQPRPALAAGAPADLMLFELDGAGEVQVRATWRAGRRVHGAAG